VLRLGRPERRKEEERPNFPFMSVWQLVAGKKRRIPSAQSIITL
jgi:hypothetical protein